MPAVVKIGSVGAWCLAGAVGLALSGGGPEAGAARPAVPVQTQAAGGPQGQAAQADPEARVFAAEAGLIFNPIRPEAAKDFEMVLGRLREALQQSPNPTRREQAKGWKVFKAQEPFQGSVLYIFVVDPAVKGADYSVTRILAEAFPTEVQSLYEKFSGAFAGKPSLVNLSPVLLAAAAPGGVTEVGRAPGGR